MDITLESLTNAFTAALKNQFGGNSAAKAPAAAPAAAPGASPDASGLGKTFGDIVKNGAPVATAFYTIGKDGKEASAVFSKLAEMSPVFSKSLGSFVSTLESSRAAVNDAAKSGIGGSNFPQLQQQAKLAGMSISDFTKLVKDGGPSLMAIGKGSDEAAKRLSTLSSEVIGSKLGQQLRAAGVSTDTLTKASAIMAQNTKIDLENDKVGKAKLVAASLDLALKMDETARATGKSTDTIASEMNERGKSAEQILMGNLMSEKQREAFKKTEIALNGMGPTITNLGQTIASGAKLSPENKAALNALGPAAGDFQKAIRMGQAATTDAQKQQADAAMQAAKAKIDEWQSSKRYANLALQGSGEVAEMQKKLIVENVGRGTAMTTARETGQTTRQALDTQQQAAGRGQRGEVQYGKDAGKVDTAQIPTRLANVAQEEARKNAAGAAIAINNMNTALGKSPAFVNNFTKAIDTMFGKVGETPQQKAKRIDTAMDKVTGDFPGSSKPSGPSKGSPLDVAPGTKLQGRAEGSKASTGSWFEDFGPEKIMALHKKEAVVPEAKLPEFMKDMLGSNQDQMQGLISKLKPPSSKAVPGMDQLGSMIGKIKMPEMPKLPAITNVGADASQRRSDDEKKKAMRDEADANFKKTGKSDTEVYSSKTQSSPNTSSSSEITMKDLHSDLLELNKNIMRMVSHTESISDASSKTARLAGKTTGNRALA